LNPEIWGGGVGTPIESHVKAKHLIDNMTFSAPQEPPIRPGGGGTPDGIQGVKIIYT